MRIQYSVLFMLLITIGIKAQEFELLGSPGVSGSVSKIVINPLNSSNIFVANTNSFFVTEDGGITTHVIYTPFESYSINDLKILKENNLVILGEYAHGYYKSTDGGKNWTSLVVDINSRKVFQVNSENEDIIYIKKNNTELWRSDNKGVDFYKVAAFNEEIISFDIFPPDTTIIFVATSFQLYKTTNSGKIWEKKVTLLHLAITDMQINPLDTNILYIQTSGILNKTEDGGKTIKKILAPGVMRFSIHPQRLNTIFAYVTYTLDSTYPPMPIGVYKSTDGGNSWVMKDTFFMPIAFSPTNPNEFYCVLSKGIFKTTDGGINWYHTNISYMNAANVIPNKEDPASLVFGNSAWGIMRSNDNGVNWFYPYFDIPPTLIEPWERSFDFNPQRKLEGFLAGSNYLYKTTDGGDNWLAVRQFDNDVKVVIYHKYCPDTIFTGVSSGQLFISTNGGNNWGLYSGSIQNSMRFVKTDPNILYGYGFVGEYNDFVARKSTDLGKTWIEINNGLLKNSETPTNKAITIVEPDINNPNNAYCGQVGGLSKTTNGGQNWFQVDSSLKILEPWLGFPSVLLDPNENGRIYVGVRGGGVAFTDQFTKGGLYLTEDDCKTWRRVFTGSVVGIYSDEGNPRRVYINTYQGVFRFLDTLTVTDIKDIPNNLPESFTLQQNYPNPFNPSTQISYQISSGSFVTLKVYDVLGNGIATLVNEEKAAGTYQVNFTVQQATNNKQLASGMSAKGGYASGVYFYTLTAGKFTDTKKFILLK